MKIDIRWEAQEEISSAITYYNSESTEATKKLSKEIREIYQLLTSFPNSGTVKFSDYRGVSLKKFPYQIIYQVKPSHIEVLAFVHHKRKPRYWTKRLT